MNRQLLKIHDNPGLVRDAETSAILISDVSALQKYKTSREYQQKKQREQDNIVARQDKLEADISEIKALLLNIASKV